MFQRILVALDHSSEASAVFESALAIAIAQKSEMLLIHMIDWQIQDVSPWVGVGTLYDVDVIGESLAFSQEYQQQQQQQSLTWLKTFADKAIAKHIDCEYECRLGNCNLGIGEQAVEWGADLIVIGRRNQKNIAEIFLGSVSNYVIHHAPCSVFVVQGKAVVAAEAASY
ncbi:UspA domain-containing protein [Chondrocystis sp. NIES-4102]|nr:UspA domain-containing protein [Chondrocystis sp. NIES-4102]